MGHDYFAGNYAPVRREHTVTELAGGCVALCEAGTGEIVDPGWSDRQGQLVESSEDP
jgi:hypothetical protein